MLRLAAFGAPEWYWAYIANRSISYVWSETVDIRIVRLTKFSVSVKEKTQRLTKIFIHAGAGDYPRSDFSATFDDRGIMSGPIVRFSPNILCLFKPRAFGT